MKIKQFLSVLLCAALLTGILMPSALADEDIIYISSEAELRSFAYNCKLDSYSCGKTIILCCDLDLSGKPFDPIGSLRGLFDGGGHTISGLELSSNGAYQGFIRFVQSDGAVKDLNIEGSIAPTELRNAVGGIAGVNYGTISGCCFDGSVSGLENTGGIAGENYGTISSCSVSGKLSGKTATGGIAGYNKGRISCCINNAEVNTVIESNSINIEDLSVSDLNTLQLVRADGENTVSDTGGIAGFSEGAVTDCSNYGTVGYKHYGYNIGGIAGRQSGYIENCENNGEVYGKKDVGGICGQMEPYLILTQVESIVEELDALSRALSSAMYHLGANVDGADVVIEELKTDVGDAADNAVEMDKNSEDPVLPQNQDENNKDSSSAGNDENTDTSGDGGSSIGSTVTDIIQGIENNLPGEEQSPAEPVQSSVSDAEGSLVPAVSSGGMAGIVPASLGYAAPLKINTLYIKPSVFLEDSSPAEAPVEDNNSADPPADTQPADSSEPSAPSSGDDSSGAGGEQTGNSGDLGGVIEDIVNGNVTEEDKEQIVDTGTGIIQQGSEAIGDKVQEKHEEENARDDAYNQSQQALNQNIKNIGANINRLNAMLSNALGDLAVDMQSVNYHFSKASMLAVNLLSGQSLYYDDISELDSLEMKDGKVYACTNNATVDGDINVGGIAGDMGIEVEYDLDGNILDKLNDTSIARNSYETRCVVRSCANKGSVNGKKDYIGGIIGYQEIGYILDCSNFGTLTGEASTYVGGIAGYSNTRIDSSYAMCDITGDKYVGGICGFGYKIKDCISVVSFTKNAAAIGTVAGWADITLYDVSEDYKPNSRLSDEEQAIELEKAKNYYVYNNIYVSDTYGAVDDLSYSTKAYPVSFEEVMQLQQLPDNFKTMTASFFADEVLVDEIDFCYGGSIDEADIPPVPEKHGYTGYWPERDYSKLSYSFSLEAIYEPNISSLSTDYTRQGEDLPLVLAEGDFACSAVMRLEEYTQSAPAVEGRLLECWEIDVDNNNYNSGEYTVHYKAPALESSKNRVIIYVEDENGLWQQTAYDRHGSYLVFSSDGNVTRFAAVEAEGNSAKLVIICAAALLVLVIIILLSSAAKKRKKTAKTK